VAGSPKRKSSPTVSKGRKPKAPARARAAKPAAKKPTRRAATPKATKSGAERRVAERAPVMVLEIRGKSYDKIFVGYAENISRSGLFFSAANPPAVGSTFPVEFVLPDNRTVVQCTCRVVWQHRYNTSGRPSIGVGVEFVDLDGIKRTLIDQWVKRKVGTPRASAATTARR
jgi:uncharacterized protein (TIGR02266 family)